MKLLKNTIAILATAALTMSASAADKNIVETAKAAGSFGTLLAAAEAAGLVDALSDKDATLTVFAPTDEAFAKLPEGTVETLLKPENKEQLAAILTYHVVPAKVMAADVKAGEVDTLNGKKLTIAITDGKVMVNKATVTATDVVASNGVIHVVDTVIIPE